MCFGFIYLVTSFYVADLFVFSSFSFLHLVIQDIGASEIIGGGYGVGH
jgi:hypothetical protein